MIPWVPWCSESSQSSVAKEDGESRCRGYKDWLPLCTAHTCHSAPRGAKLGAVDAVALGRRSPRLHTSNDGSNKFRKDTSVVLQFCEEVSWQLSHVVLIMMF